MSGPSTARAGHIPAMVRRGVGAGPADLLGMAVDEAREYVRRELARVAEGLTGQGLPMPALAS